MNTDFLIEKSVQIRQIRVIRVPNHGNSQRAEVLVFPVAVSDLNAISYNNLKAWMRVEGVPLGIVANFHDLALKPVILKA